MVGSQTLHIGKNFPSLILSELEGPLLKVKTAACLIEVLNWNIYIDNDSSKKVFAKQVLQTLLKVFVLKKEKLPVLEDLVEGTVDRRVEQVRQALLTSKSTQSVVSKILWDKFRDLQLVEPWRLSKRIVYALDSTTKTPTILGDATSKITIALSAYVPPTKEKASENGVTSWAHVAGLLGLQAEDLDTEAAELLAKLSLLGAGKDNPIEQLYDLLNVIAHEERTQILNYLHKDLNMVYPASTHKGDIQSEVTAMREDEKRKRTVTGIYTKLRKQQSTVSQHLSKLKNTGLVDFVEIEWARKESYYYIRQEVLECLPGIVELLEKIVKVEVPKNQLVAEHV